MGMTTFVRKSELYSPLGSEIKLALRHISIFKPIVTRSVWEKNQGEERSIEMTRRPIGRAARIVRHTCPDCFDSLRVMSLVRWMIESKERVELKPEATNQHQQHTQREQ